MSNGVGQPQVSTFALLAGAAAAVAASAAAAGATAAIRRLPKPRLASQAWQALLDDEGRIHDQQRFAGLCQQGVDPGLRQSVWPLLLRLLPLDSTSAERQHLCSELEQQHRRLLAEAQAASTASSAHDGSRAGSNGGADLCVIGKASGDSDSSNGVDTSGGGGDGTDFANTQRCITMDVLRTDFEALASSRLTGELEAAVTLPGTTSGPPACECISTAAQDALHEAHYLSTDARRQAARLFNLLCVYAVHDTRLGYAQGMSDLAAIFLTVFPDNDALAFWCFERLMRGARDGFRHDECGIRRQLRQLSVLLSRADPPLHQQLNVLQAADCLFAYRMVVVLLLRDLPTAQAVRLWECSWAAQRLQEQVAGMATPVKGATTDASATAAESSPFPSSVSLLQAFVLAVICGERRHVLQQCTTSDDVICHFATIRIRFEATLREARRLQQEL